MQRFDIRHRGHPDRLTPGQKLAHGTAIGAAGMRVTDIGGKEIDKAHLRAATGHLDQRGQGDRFD